MRIRPNLFLKTKKTKKVTKVRKIKPLKVKGSIKGKKITKGKSKYKEGWHTTWDGKKVYLRSGDEFKFARQLDKQKLVYEVETIEIYYFDTQQKQIRKGIPDFYIPSKNLIVEIKGAHLFNLQNLKDRQKAILAKGYLFEVMVDGRKLTML
jgi:hypothetical protein